MVFTVKRVKRPPTKSSTETVLSVMYCNSESTLNVVHFPLGPLLGSLFFRSVSFVDYFTRVSFLEFLILEFFIFNLMIMIFNSNTNVIVSLGISKVVRNNLDNENFRTLRYIS